jgi:hypothetical protein
MRVISLFMIFVALVAHVSGCASIPTSGTQSGGGHPPPRQVTVSITNKFSSELTGGAIITLNAVVSNDSTNAGVTWTLTAGGANCSPACGTLTAITPPNTASPKLNIIYTPPAALPAAPNSAPTITATSVADASRNDSFSFSLSFSVGVLTGKYAFLLKGFGPNGVPEALAGTVSLNTSGNIDGGEIDINVGGQVTKVPAPLTGSYLVDTSFNGVTRGTITFTNVIIPGTTSNLTLKCMVSADGKRGRVIEYDASGFKSAGTFLQQDLSALNTTIPTGTFAFGLDSDSATGARVVEAGEFSLSAAGITGGLVDQRRANDANPIYSAASILPGLATPPDSSGRGTLALTVGGNSMQYAYYLVSSAQFFLIEIDNGQAFGTVQAGVAHLQSPLTAGSVNGTGVIQLTGIDKTFGTQNLGPAAIIGVLSVSGGNSLNLTFDGNDAGTVLTSRPVTGQVVSFDPTTGRGVLSVTMGAIGGFLNSAVFYLYGPGSGFIIDADPTTPAGTPADLQVANKAYSGTLTPQATGPFSNSSLSGNVISVSGASATPLIPDIITAANMVSSNGSITAIADVASLDSQLGNTANRTFGEDYQVLDPTLGHGSAVFPPGYFGNFSSNQPAPATFYLLGQNQMVMIGVLSGSDSGVTFFDPN